MPKPRVVKLASCICKDCDGPEMRMRRPIVVELLISMNFIFSPSKSFFGQFRRFFAKWGLVFAKRGFLFSRLYVRKSQAVPASE